MFSLVLSDFNLVERLFSVEAWVTGKVGLESGFLAWYPMHCANVANSDAGVCRYAVKFLLEDIAHAWPVTCLSGQVRFDATEYRRIFDLGEQCIKDFTRLTALTALDEAGQEALGEPVPCG